ncbi:2-(S)-hydroxypropyl-CoM dehydrogenase (plasmid) [Mesorhizobium loti]|nr:2-(S)-hydroxypropyl-CoM dehydrogenase [Mesorhizobium loti]
MRSAFMFTCVTLALCAARGSVVMVSSVDGRMGEEEGLAIYSASVIALAYSLAREISEVRFNAGCQVKIATRMAGTLAIPGRRALLESRIPVGCREAPRVSPRPVAWLLSPASSFRQGDRGAGGRRRNWD